MFVIGMLLGGQSLREVFGTAGLPCLRSQAYRPAPRGRVLFGLTRIASVHPDGHNILLIIIMCASSAAAVTITQFAQLYDKQPEHAGVINVMSVILCIITMPLMLALFQML
jgi:hypothetical protein